MRVAREPLRPRRSPNRNGYQADAAGEKRTVGIRGTKRLGNSKAPFMFIFVVEFFSNPKQVLAQRF